MRRLHRLIEHGSCNQVEANRIKIKEAFRIKLLELCKKRTKKSSPDMFKFYVILAGPDMVIDAGRATKCRQNFKAPSLQTKSTKNEGPFENMSFSEKKNLKISTKKK